MIAKKTPTFLSPFAAKHSITNSLQTTRSLARVAFSGHAARLYTISQITHSLARASLIRERIAAAAVRPEGNWKGLERHDTERKREKDRVSRFMTTTTSATSGK